MSLMRGPGPMTTVTNRQNGPAVRSQMLQSTLALRYPEVDVLERLLRVVELYRLA
jgi:hypothetical protein